MSARELLKEAEFMSNMEVASTVAEAIVKFKKLEEFTALLKKDYHNGYDAGVWKSFTISGQSIGTSTIQS